MWPVWKAVSPFPLPTPRRKAPGLTAPSVWKLAFLEWAAGQGAGRRFCAQCLPYLQGARSSVLGEILVAPRSLCWEWGSLESADVATALHGPTDYGKTDVQISRGSPHPRVGRGPLPPRDPSSALCSPSRAHPTLISEPGTSALFSLDMALKWLMMGQGLGGHLNVLGPPGEPGR